MRSNKHLRRLIAVLAILVVLAGALTFPSGWGCRLAERIARRIYPVNAIPGLVFRVRHVSATCLDLGGVVLGSATGAPGIEQITVRFTPRGLLRRTISSVACEGPHARLVVGSNRVTLVGAELLEGVLHRRSRGAAASPWRLGEATVTGLRVQLVPERNDHGWPDEIGGTLRLQHKGGDKYQVAVRGAAMDIPFWGTAEGSLAARGGDLAATFPLVPIAVVKEAMARFAPHAPQLPLEGVCHLSVQAGFSNAVPEVVTVMALTREPLRIEAGGRSLSLASLVAAVNWRSGKEPLGDLTKVAIEGRLAGLQGLPSAIAAGLDQAQFRFGLDPATVTNGVDGLRLSGDLMLPAIAPLADGAENRIGLWLAAATNRVRIAVQVPPLAGIGGAADAAFAWRAGGVGLQAEARREDSSGAWLVSGSGALSNACVSHALAHASNVTVRLPFQVRTDPSVPDGAQITLGAPEIGWSMARLLGAEVAPPVALPRNVSQPGYLLDESFRIGAAGSALQMETRVAVSRAGGVEAGLRCGPVELTERDPFVVAALDRLGLPAEIRGTLAFAGMVSLNGRVALDPGREMVWHGATGVEAGRVMVGGAVPGALEGLRTAMRVEGVGPRYRIAPLETTFTNAVLAGIGIHGGTVDWRIDGRELLVEKAELNWCGGKARIYAVRVDLANPDIDLVLYIDRMEAGELIRLIKPLDGTATGRLYGRLPLRIRQGRVQLSDGFLYALPGERGNLKLRDTRFLQDYFERAGLSSTMRRNLADALADLDYDVLRVDLSTTAAREGKLIMKLAGQAAGNRGLPPVDLDIRVNGPLEALLNLGLQVNKTAP